MKKILFTYWPLLFIIFLWFIFSYPYFLKGKVPYPSTYQVNFFAPWSHFEKFWGPIKNNAMPDVIDQIYPWKHFTIETWKKGEIPLWNPNSFSGNPHLANYQSAVLSPFNILFFVLPFIDAWSILVLLQPLLAGFFTYLLLREYGVKNIGALTGSISFMFCGFIVVWMAYGTLSMSISFLPLALYAVEKCSKKITKSSSILIILSICLSFFSGHFQTSLYFSTFVFLYILFKIFSEKKYNTSFGILLIFLIGILISCFQIVPSIQLYLNSVRSEIFINGGGIPLFYLVNLFSPDFFGNPVTRNDWYGFYAEWASFVGIIPLILFFYSFRSKNYSAWIFYFFLTIGTLVLAIDSPLQRYIGILRIPVFSTSDPNRIIVLTSFCLSILAGFGFNNVLAFIREKKLVKILPPLLIIGSVLIFAWVSLLLLHSLPIDKLIIAKRNLILPTLLYFIFLLLLGAMYVLRNKYLIPFFCLYILLATSFDSFRFAQKWMPFDPKNLVFPNLSVIETMKKNVGHGRVFGNLGGYVDTYYNVPSIEGYDPLYIGRYGEFIRSANTGNFLKGERSVVSLGKRGKYTDRVLDLLGVSLIFHPIADTNQGWAYPVWDKKERYALIYQDTKFQLFKNTKTLPRAILFYDYEVEKNDKEIIRKFYNDTFEFRKKVILEEPINKTIKTGVGKTAIEDYSPNRIVIRVQTSDSAILFLSDNYYPGWRATIDGIETHIYRADYTFRAVIVDKGEHTVVFTYNPFSVL